MPLKVLLATDGSSNAEDAAWLVSQMARTEPIDVILMTVIQLPEVGGMVAVESWLPELLQREQQAATEIHQAVQKLFEGAQGTLTSVIREGLIGHEIVVEATERNVDLVVIGAKGHSTVDRILLGSVSDYVATHVHCSALVVRPTGLKEGADRRIRVAVGFDNSGSSERAIAEFQRFTLPQAMELDVVAVCHVEQVLAQVRVLLRLGHAPRFGDVGAHPGLRSQHNGFQAIVEVCGFRPMLATVMVNLLEQAAPAQL